MSGAVTTSDRPLASDMAIRMSIERWLTGPGFSIAYGVGSARDMWGEIQSLGVTSIPLTNAENSKEDA